MPSARPRRRFKRSIELDPERSRGLRQPGHPLSRPGPGEGSQAADRQGDGGRSVLRHRAGRARTLPSADRRTRQGDEGPAGRIDRQSGLFAGAAAARRPATTKAATEPAEQALENADRLDPNDPVTSSFETAIAIDDYDSDRAIESAQETLKRARARGGDYASISANRDAGSLLNEAFRLQGLDAWGRYYGDVVFDPFSGAG